MSSLSLSAVCRVGRSGRHERLPGAHATGAGEERPDLVWRAPCVVILLTGLAAGVPHGDRAPRVIELLHRTGCPSGQRRCNPRPWPLPVGLVTYAPGLVGLRCSTAHAGALRAGHPTARRCRCRPGMARCHRTAPSCSRYGGLGNIDPQTAGHGLQSRHDSERPPSRPAGATALGRRRTGPAMGAVWARSSSRWQLPWPWLSLVRGSDHTPTGIGPSLTQGLTVGLAASVAGLVVPAIGDRERSSQQQVRSVVGPGGADENPYRLGTSTGGSVVTSTTSPLLSPPAASTRGRRRARGGARAVRLPGRRAGRGPVGHGPTAPAQDVATVAALRVAAAGWMSCTSTACESVPWPCWRWRTRCPLVVTLHSLRFRGGRVGAAIHRALEMVVASGRRPGPGVLERSRAWPVAVGGQAGPTRGRPRPRAGDHLDR